MIDRACISLNNRCNLRCQYCHFAGSLQDTSAADLEFSPGEAEAVVDNIAAYCSAKGVKSFKLGIVGAGEPFLSWEALKCIVLRAKCYGGLFRVYTITNGVALTDEQLRFCFENRDTIDLNFSLDGDEAAHNTFRSGFHRTMDAIGRYEALFGGKPRINATVTRPSIDRKETLLAFFLGNGFMKINFSVVVGADDPQIRICRAEYEAFLDTCEGAGITMRQRRGDIGETYDCAMYGRLCGVGHTNIYIARDGIYPCARLHGLPEYWLGSYNSAFTEIEARFAVLGQVTRGGCYHEEYVGGHA